MPLRSSGRVIGRLELVMLRKPISQREALELVLLELGEELLPDRAIHHAVDVLEAREEIGQVEHVELRDEGGEERVAGEADVERAEAQVLQDAGIVAERATRVHLDHDLSVRALLDRFGEALSGEVKRVARRQRMRHLERRLRAGRPGAAEGAGDGEACKENRARHRGSSRMAVLRQPMFVQDCTRLEAREGFSPQNRFARSAE